MRAHLAVSSVLRRLSHRLLLSPLHGKVKEAAHRGEVDRNLELLDKQLKVADGRYSDNTILGPLKDKRVATIDRRAIAIGHDTPKPQGLERLALCKLSNDDAGSGNNGGGNAVQAVP